MRSDRFSCLLPIGCVLAVVLGGTAGPAGAQAQPAGAREAGAGEAGSGNAGAPLPYADPGAAGSLVGGTGGLGDTEIAVPSATLASDPKDPAVIEAERTLRGAELEAIRRDLDLTAGRQAEIAAEIARIADDSAALDRDLMETAARVQDLESAVSAAEGRLSGLADQAALVRTSLDGRKAILADVLAAAQRIGRRPPPALVVKPEDAVGAVRSAILLGAVLPEVRVEAEALAADLATLVDVKRRAEDERDRLRQDAGRFVEAQKRLELLLAEKRSQRAERAAALVAEAAKAEALAEKAKSLEELIGSMERDLTSVREAARQAAEAARRERPAPSDTGRLQPAIAFQDAKGRLMLPVRGVTVQDFGADNGLGGTAAGLSVATRAGARVTAPADGWVVYVGSFRSYGQLLILNAGGGYHVVLAGMERIDVELGQFVLTGEPVGVMGSQRLASATVPDVSLSQPVLYIEFRKDGASIDPTPWWVASQDRKVRG
ncbi:murein hydrolase activator EnvC family protein [Mongoliimonas terrestris]|uniref:murein hydrolase activator EnvC family protein n=1 Tax=Mongoliimonas terrestris TaxID=1709001 RepID=UPI0009FA365D|nr:peptidoglycan DD-metalloendopeptidase family protein [Mongoliimonas terrestris]